MLNHFFYQSYRIFFSLRRWRRLHINPAGLIVISIILFSGLFGFNIFRTTLYQLFALAAVIGFLALCFNSFPLRVYIHIQRHLPEFASVGETASYDLEIKNRSQKKQTGLILFESIKDPRPGFYSLISIKEPFEHLRNAWDKRTLYFRWEWMVQKELKAAIAPVQLPDLMPNESVRIKVHFTPHHRGILHFEGIILARPDLFGCFNRIARIKKVQRLTILPKRYSLKAPDLISTRQYHPGGINLASAIGDSNEFMTLRPYRPGDPLRNIHWRSFAKTNELVIKEFEDEFFVRHALILDTFIGDQNELVFEKAISIASSYIQNIQKTESIMDLMFVGDRAYSFSSGRGLSHSEKMLEIMASVQPGYQKSIETLIPELKRNIKQLSGSICIFLNWTESHNTIIDLFKKAGIPAFVLVLCDEPDTLEQKISVSSTNTLKIKPVHVESIEKELG